MSGTALFWLAPCFPLVACALLAVGLSRFGRLASGLAVAAMAGASIVSVFGLLSAIQGKHGQVSLPWLSIGGRQLTLALWLSPLRGLLATVVSLVAPIVFIYAVNYMARDSRRGRSFAAVSLVPCHMLPAVSAADLI